MNVRVLLSFEAIGDDEFASMRSLARSLTDDPESVRVLADGKPGWLIAEFTMPTEAQYRALPEIDSAIHLHGWREPASAFPPSKAARASADPKAMRRRARRGKP